MTKRENAGVETKQKNCCDGCQANTKKKSKGHALRVIIKAQGLRKLKQPHMVEALPLYHPATAQYAYGLVLIAIQLRFRTLGRRMYNSQTSPKA